MKHHLIGAVAAFAFSSSFATAQSISIEFYGGISAPGAAFYRGGDYSLDSGTAYGLGIYTDRFGGVELGLDVMQTDRLFTGYSSHQVTTSYMLAARFPFASNGKFTPYVGAGIGAIDVGLDYSGPAVDPSGSALVAGAQASIGARYAIGRGDLFVEGKYQFALDNVTYTSTAYPTGATMSYNSTNIVIGYRYNF